MTLKQSTTLHEKLTGNQSMNTNIKKTLYVNNIFMSVRHVVLLKYTIKYPNEGFLFFAVGAVYTVCKKRGRGEKCSLVRVYSI